MEHKNSTARRAKMAARASSRERRCATPVAKLTGAAARAIVVERSQQTETRRPDEAGGARVEVVEAYFDATGRPIKRKGLGAARVARRYDERGNQVEEAYFTAEGKPTLRTDLGVARIAWRYDERGNRIEAEFFGADGALIETPAATGRRKRQFEDA
jgi:YD repeat-containing protein